MNTPKRVLISGGRRIGGVASFANNLAEGFWSQGLSVEIITPLNLLRRWRDLRDPRVLKILSTTGVFAVPLCRQAICIAHGIPRADVHGWIRFLSILATFRLANLAGAPLVAVSEYVAAHLRSLFDLRIDAVILNPLSNIFLTKPTEHQPERNWITYVGRLSPEKKLHHLLPALKDLLNMRPELKVCIIGDGPERSNLERLVLEDARFDFRGHQDDFAMRDQLRRSKVFVSGNEIEGLGIVYQEALSQGCNVVMPASGGGLEIALPWIGRHIQLMPLSFDRAEIVATLIRALANEGPEYVLNAYRPENVAATYLSLYRV